MNKINKLLDKIPTTLLFLLVFFLIYSLVFTSLDQKDKILAIEARVALYELRDEMFTRGFTEAAYEGTLEERVTRLEQQLEQQFTGPDSEIKKSLMRSSYVLGYKASKDYSEGCLDLLSRRK